MPNALQPLYSKLWERRKERVSLGFSLECRAVIFNRGSAEPKGSMGIC